MIVFDANFLIFFLDPKLNKGKKSDPRIDYLISVIEKTNDRIVIPTPALSELMVGADGAISDYLEIIHASKFFRIEPFGERAAIELATMTRVAIAMGRKRGAAAEDAPWAKVKFDRQILAIARVVGATTIYSNDGDLVELSKEVGTPALRLEDLRYPPVPPQTELEFRQSSDLVDEN